MTKLTKEILTTMFGSDEALGITYRLDDGSVLSPKAMRAMLQEVGAKKMPNTESQLPGGDSAVVCTAYAAYIAETLPGRVQLRGFDCADNPEAKFSRQGLAEGHDFAIVDGRFLVDPWMKLVVGDDVPVVLDLYDQIDVAQALAFYGPVDKWLSDEAQHVPEHEQRGMVDMMYSGHRPLAEYDAVEIEDMVQDPMDHQDVTPAVDYPELPVTAFSVRLHLRSGGTDTVKEIFIQGSDDYARSHAERKARDLAVMLGNRIIATDPALERRYVLGSKLDEETKPPADSLVTNPAEHVKPTDDSALAL